MNAKAWWNMLAIRFAVAGALSLGMCSIAHATYWFRVADAGQIRWLLANDGNGYLRNLNSFDGSVLGCCYNYLRRHPA